MNHLVTIKFIEHLRNGVVLWRSENIKNIIHLEGREYLIKAAFSNDGSLIPLNYYLGLDSRDTLAAEDNMSSITDEPIGSGYVRQPIPTDGTGFTISNVSGVYKALSQIVTFSASGTGWGPVKNMFLTTESDNSGILISSIFLTSPLSTSAGDTVSIQIQMSLQDV